jgi:hypothetical protein
MNEAPYCDDRNRGRIILPEKARRLCDMRTMRMNGGITPTDVDGWFCHPARLTGLVEYRRSSYWLHEFKPLGGDMKEGQRIALECLVDDLASSGRYAVLVLAIEPPGTHEFKPSEAKVLKVRFAYAWHVSAPITLLESEKTHHTCHS